MSLVRLANEVEAEVEKAEENSIDYERGLSVTKSERLHVRISGALHELSFLAGESGHEALAESSPELAAHLKVLPQRFHRYRDIVARLTP